MMTLKKFHGNVVSCTTLPEGLAESLISAKAVADVRKILSAVIETEYNIECDWLYSLTASIDDAIEKQSRNLVHNRTLGATCAYKARYKDIVISSFGFMIDGIVFVYTRVKPHNRRAIFVKRMYNPHTDSLVVSGSTENEYAEEHFMCTKLSSRKYFTGKMLGCS